MSKPASTALAPKLTASKSAPVASVLKPITPNLKSRSHPPSLARNLQLCLARSLCQRASAKPSKQPSAKQSQKLSFQTSQNSSSKSSRKPSSMFRQNSLVIPSYSFLGGSTVSSDITWSTSNTDESSSHPWPL